MPITTSSCSPAAHPVLSFPPFQNTSSSTSSPLSFSLPLPPSVRLCLALNLLRPRTLPAVWRRLGSISQQKLEHVPAADSRLILQHQHQLQLIVAFNANNLAQLATCETQSKEAVRRRIGSSHPGHLQTVASAEAAEGVGGTAGSSLVWSLSSRNALLSQVSVVLVSQSGPRALPRLYIKKELQIFGSSNCL